MNKNKALEIKSWKKALLSRNSSLQDAIHCLNNSLLQIVIVVESDGKLVGTLTDGDIRRGLLRGLSMKDSIESVVQKEPMVVPQKISQEEIIRLMRTNEIRQLPVVDQSKKVIGLHLLDNLLEPEKRENQMIIMAGGAGTRLRPHTESCPKPMLPIDGKPILEYIIERAKAEGFQHFILAVHYLGNVVKDYFDDGSRWNVQIDYLHEKNPLGTAGAMNLLQPKPNLPFIVSNGDVLTNIKYGDLLDYHIRYDADATMAVRLHEDRHPYGVVLTKGIDFISLEEKPIIRNHVNAGVYAFSPSSLEQLKIGKHCDMPNLFMRLKENNFRTIVYPTHEPWIDIGHEDDLKKAKLDNKKHKN